MTNPFSWAVSQLANVQRVERQEPKFNPRPPGVIQAGSASEAVLLVLRANPTTFYTHGRLMELTGRTHASISWALKYLRDQRLVRTIGDDARNPNWLRYAAEIGAAHAEIAEQPRKKEGGQRLARDEAPMSGAGLSRLPQVRRGGYQSLSAVGGELRPVPGGRWTAAEPKTLAGPEGHQQALHARELHLDRADTPETAPPVLPEGDRAGADADRSGGQPNTWPTYQEHRPAALGGGIQLGAAEAGQALQALDVVDLPGRDAASAGVGSEVWPAEQHCLAAHQARCANQPSLFAVEAIEGRQQALTRTHQQTVME